MASNGRVPLTSLTAVSGTYLHPTTAIAFQRMSDGCFAAIGRLIDIVNGAGGYRDWAAQLTLFLHPPAGVNVAAPGFSTHGRGRALDLTTVCFTPAVEAWLRQHCAEYGFTVPPGNDRRHFYHDGVTTGPITKPAQTPTTPAPPKEIVDMSGSPVIRSTGGTIVQLFDTAPPKTFTFPELTIAYATAKAYNGTQKFIDVTNEELIVLVAANTARAAAADGVDEIALAAAIKRELEPLLTDDNEVDDGPAIVAAVKAALMPEFAAVHANIDDQPTRFTIEPKL